MAAKSIREQLLERSDLREKTLEWKDLGLSVTIRRASVGERKKVMADHKVTPGVAAQDPEAFGEALMKLCVVGELTDEDIRDMPSILSDRISKAILDFNGWGTQGAAELVDQFPVK